MSERQLRRLIILSACLVITLVVANLLALKIWSFCGIPVDAGILIFPLSYIAGDLLVEFYGERVADFVAFVAAGFGIVTIIVVYLANCLPNYPGADNSGFDAVSNLAGQIFLASIISFLFGQAANNRLFEIIRIHHCVQEMLVTTGPEKMAELGFFRAFAQRAIVSSSAAHAVDAIVFEMIAFYGKLPVAEFIRQIIWAYVFGLLLELCLFPVTYFLAKKGHSTP